MNDSMFSQIDFGPLDDYLKNDDITDISYSNNGQVWVKTLSKGIYRVDNEAVNNAFMEKLAFQCANVMGKTFNMAHPFLDAEGAELRLNFVHESIARNGIAVLIRKTPAKIRLEKDKLLKEDYLSLDIHDFLIYCVQGHCNIIVCGETGSGKTEFVKYLAAHTKEDEKLITIEDTLELHLDRIFPHRDIVAMKTNNIASYSDVLVTCMRQNPKWILLSEVRSAEAVLAVRNSISSGHYILSTIHADKASSIPNRMYSLLETNQDIDQFLKSIYRYIQLGVYIRGYQDKNTKQFHREIAEVTEFYVTEDNKAEYNTIYKKTTTGKVVRKSPSKYLIDYLDAQGVILPKDIIKEGETIDPLMSQNSSQINQKNQLNQSLNNQNYQTQNKQNIQMNNIYQNKQGINYSQQVYRQVPNGTTNTLNQDLNKA
ncbi:MAG: type II/IV secretion system ATPase subunit [Bacilli bacterium]|nr:type II/IV secretion system ATPase subunit [Bacilli bacterium]